MNFFHKELYCHYFQILKHHHSLHISIRIIQEHIINPHRLIYMNKSAILALNPQFPVQGSTGDSTRFYVGDLNFTFVMFWEYDRTQGVHRNQLNFEDKVFFNMQVKNDFNRNFQSRLWLHNCTYQQILKPLLLRLFESYFCIFVLLLHVEFVQQKLLDNLWLPNCEAYNQIISNLYRFLFSQKCLLQFQFKFIL